MHRPVYLLGIVAFAAIVTACGSPSTPVTPVAPLGAATTTTTPAVGTGTPAAGTPTTGTPAAGTAVSGTPTALGQTTVTPTVVETPTVSPTPGPPTLTATPAPSAAVLQSAEALDQAVVSFAQAQASGDTQATLQAQQKLLSAAQDAAKTAAADQSPYGQKLRSALDAVQGGAAGNYDQLNSAHQDLAQIMGSNGTPVAGSAGYAATPMASLPRPAAQSQQSLNDVASTLQRSVDAYTKALNGGNSGDLLRAQRDLLDAVATANTATKNAHSPMAQQIQQALNQIHDGMGGDTSKFAAADNTLANLSGQNGNNANGTPTAGTNQQVNLQPLQNDLDNKLQTLQVETTDQNKDNLKQAQDNLNQSIQKASAALANDHSPAADRFRNALSTAQGAVTDNTKIQTARDQLKAALNGQ